MTSIYLNPNPASEWGPDRARTVRTGTTSWASPTVSAGFDQAQARATLAQARPTLGVTLENRLRAFSRALNAFAWDQTSSGQPTLYQARLVSADPGLQGKVSSSLVSAEEASPYYQAASSGQDPRAATPLAPGAYSFRIRLGDTQSEDLSVAVAAGDTRGDVLAAVAQAVNDAALPVQAQVLTQKIPDAEFDGLFGGREVLALAVNPANSREALTFLDLSGRLLDTLGLASTPRAVGSASAAVHSLRGTTTAGPSSILTRSMDPEAEAPLTPGVYGLTVSQGASSFDVSVTVSEGDTWRTVLNNTAAAIAGTGLATARTVTAPRPSDLVTDPDLNPLMDGVALQVTAANPKLGQRLSITGGAHQGAGAFTVASVADGTLQVDRDQYEALQDGSRVAVAQDAATDELPAPLTHAGATTPRSYYVNKAGMEFGGANEGFEGLARIRLADTAADAQNGTNLITLDSAGSGTFSLQMDDLGEAVGLQAQWPGSDGVMDVDGRTQVRAPGVFSQDQGRLELSLEDSFGQTLPLKVADFLDQVSDSMNGAVNAYNDLRTFLLGSRDLFTRDLAAELAAPLSDPDLAGLGLRQWGARKLLSLDAESFVSAAAGDRDAAREALLGQGRLIPSWKTAVESLLNLNPDTLVTAQSALENAYLPPVREEADLERRNKIMELIG